MHVKTFIFCCVGYQNLTSYSQDFYFNSTLIAVHVELSLIDLSGCWQFAKCALGTNSSGLCFFRGELLFGSLGLGAIDVIIRGRGSLLPFNMRSLNPRTYKQKNEALSSTL